MELVAAVPGAGVFEHALDTGVLAGKPGVAGSRDTRGDRDPFPDGTRLHIPRDSVAALAERVIPTVDCLNS